MGIPIKIDEDLPKRIAARASEAGYDASTVLEEGLAGWPDSEVWEAAQREGRLLVTADKGFADIRRHAPGTHCGVLLLRPAQDGILPISDLFSRRPRSLRVRLLERIRRRRHAAIRIRRK